MKFLLTPLLLALLLLPAFSGPAGAADDPLPVIPPDQERLLRSRIDDLFPEGPRQPLPEPSSAQTALGVASNVGYMPLKALVAVIYSLSGFLHHAALEGTEGRRIIVEGWTGDWAVTGRHISGAEPLDIVGPDRRFQGHNPVARDTFIRSYFMLYSSVPYRGLPKGLESEPGNPATPPGAEAAPAEPVSPQGSSEKSFQ